MAHYSEATVLAHVLMKTDPTMTVDHHHCHPPSLLPHQHQSHSLNQTLVFFVVHHYYLHSLGFFLSFHPPAVVVAAAVDVDVDVVVPGITLHPVLEHHSHHLQHHV